jgi:putative sterol carrier protein
MTDTAQAVQNIFQTMPTRLDPNAASGLNAVIQYDLSGEGGGQYASHIHDGTCEVTPGQHASPTMTLSMAAPDFVDLIEGRLDGMTAFMSGKLRISGDMGLAMRMQSLFKS